MNSERILAQQSVVAGGSGGGGWRPSWLDCCFPFGESRWEKVAEVDVYVNLGATAQPLPPPQAGPSAGQCCCSGPRYPKSPPQPPPSPTEGPRPRPSHGALVAAVEAAVASDRARARARIRANSTNHSLRYSEVELRGRRLSGVEAQLLQELWKSAFRGGVSE